MEPALRIPRPRYPDNWGALYLGETLKRLADQRLGDISRKLFGYYLVKLGNLSSELQLPECPIKHKINFFRHIGYPASNEFAMNIVGEPLALPFAERCIDAFVIAHELDFSHDPHQLLREVDRCIMPDGHIVIIGFNPISLTGAAKWLSIRKNNYLRDARCFSAGRVKDWLSLLGYQITQVQYYVHSPLVFEGAIDLDSYWSRFANKYLPFLASVYLIVGKKCEFPLSLIKPTWQIKTRFTPVGASMRVASSN